MIIKVDASSIRIALNQLGSLRCTDDKVSSFVAGIKKNGINCCKLRNLLFVGHIAVADDKTGKRFKRISVCKCCGQLHVDDNCRVVTGHITDYMEKLISKHNEIVLHILNPAALGQSAPMNYLIQNTDPLGTAAPMNSNINSA